MRSTGSCPRSWPISTSPSPRGKRLAPYGSASRPTYRHVVARIYNTLIRVLAVPGIQDTQCGFKCFRAEVAEQLFRRQTLPGWSFDVELLYLVRRLGYRIVEIPIRWHFNPNSHISVVRDSLRMGLDIFRIRLNGLQGKYERPL